MYLIFCITLRTKPPAAEHSTINCALVHWFTSEHCGSGNDSNTFNLLKLRAEYKGPPWRPVMQVIRVESIMRKVCVCPDNGSKNDKDHVLNDLMEREPIDKRWLDCEDLSPVPLEYQWPPPLA